MRNQFSSLFIVSGLIHMALMVSPSFAAEEFNYDEAKVPAYELPDLLTDHAGNEVATAEAWTGHRRAQVMQLVESHEYGAQPKEPVELSVHDVVSKEVPGGTMIRRTLTLRCTRGGKHVDLDMLIYLPAKGPKPCPLFVGLNFNGNHTVTSDTDIPLTKNWVRNSDDLGYQNNVATESSRGASSSRWPITEIIARGYGVATIYCGDIDPDFDDGFANGVHALYADQPRDAASWGTISAWAWGLSRAMDYFEQDADIDARRVAVMGHSRLGKAALWAGASDERFAMVVSNDSGCGGAALSRRRFGETVARINTSFPHWFCDNFKRYNDKEDECPVDQHSLLALIAPRPLLICSAVDDRWADPKGEFLGGKAASVVYRLLGTDGMATPSWPQPNMPVMSRVGYHIRPGGHDVTLVDWTVYMDFADKHMAK